VKNESNLTIENAEKVNQIEKKLKKENLMS